MYVELHARSAFSFLEGASAPEELAEACAERGMAAMALADRDGVYGAPRFHLAAKKRKIRAHIGAEVTAAEGSAATGKPASAGWRYTLLAESRAGYQNLCRLITRMKLRAAKGEGCAAPEEIAELSGGLICLTGGDEGPLAHALERGGLAGATECVRELCRAFGRDNVYVELQRHSLRWEEARNRAVVEIARTLKLPLLATNGVSYARPEQREVLDVFTCIRHHRTIETAGRLLSRNTERYCKTHAEMSQLFADLPEAIANTEKLSSRLQFTLNDLGYEFPKYPVPGGGSQMEFLRRRALDGMIWRYGANDAKARRQIERELALIEKLDLAGYFLIVWDIVRFCGEQGVLVQGRGSAANSAVCYALGITAVDPVGMDLLFERFLVRGARRMAGHRPRSAERRAARARDSVRVRALREAGRGDDRQRDYVSRAIGGAGDRQGVVVSMPRRSGTLTALVGSWEYRDPGRTVRPRIQRCRTGYAATRACGSFSSCARRCRICRVILGQHSGGMVMCQGQLDSVVPLEPATMPGRVVVQWDKEDCADMGIVKVDLLGLGMMAVLEESLQLIRAHHGEAIDLGQLPQDDPAIYSALQKADTVGMFQVESRAQMSCLPRLRPKCFYDIVVQVAIIRPGPIVGKMVHPYLQRRQGREAPEYLHPDRSSRCWRARWACRCFRSNCCAWP